MAKRILILESIPTKEPFGRCSCAGEILYYTDRGVRCSTCGKLYGVWTNQHHSQIKRTLRLIEETRKPRSEDNIEQKNIEQIIIEAV